MGNGWVENPWRECDPLLDNGVVCMPCDPGSYKSSTSADRCTPCTGGTFNPERGSADQSWCQACEAGKASTTAGASDKNQCVQCATGTWAPARSLTCRLCPLGTFNSVRGSGSITDCQACPAGMSSLPGAATATECFDDSGMFNMFVAEGSSNRVSTFSRSTAGFAPVFQGSPLNAPYGLVFISAIHFIVACTANNQILKFMYDGTYVGVFASVSEPRGLLLLPDLEPPQVAAAVTIFDGAIADFGTTTEKKILFLSADSGAVVNEVVLPYIPGWVYSVHDLAAVGGTSGEMLATVQISHDGTFRNVWLFCIPNTPCTHAPANIFSYYDNLASLVFNPARVAKISSRSTYFLNYEGSTYEVSEQSAKRLEPPSLVRPRLVRV